MENINNQLIQELLLNHGERVSNASGKVPYPCIPDRTKLHRDPIIGSKTRKRKKKRPNDELVQVPKDPQWDMSPALKIRLDFGKHCDPDSQIPEPRPKFIVPKSRKQRKEMLERRKKEEIERNFCKYEIVKLPSPIEATRVPVKLGVPSPDVSKAKVAPRKPSFSPSAEWPDSITPSVLELHKPKSGIIVNETEPKKIKEDLDSFNLVFERRPRPSFGKPQEHETLTKTKRKKRRKKKRSSSKGDGSVDPETGERITKKKRKKKRSTSGDEGSTDAETGEKTRKKRKTYKKSEEGSRKSGSTAYESVGDNAMAHLRGRKFDTIVEEAEEELLAMIKEEGDEGEEGGWDDKELGDAETFLTKMFRRKVSQVSAATSLNERDLIQLPVYEDEGLEEVPQINRIVQKFRRDSEEERYKPPPRKVKRGTLESHSYTKIKQPILKSFYFGSIPGTIHQGDEHFSDRSRNRQGMTMPVAAYCYAILKHPNKWTEGTIDAVLEVGDALYSESIDHLHVHDESKELRAKDLQRHCFIGEKKVRFEVHEPEIAGHVRSEDKKIYNITKALNIFFKRQNAGIFQTYGTNILIWKQKYYYLFDATPRSKDLSQDSKGTAILANFYDIPAIATVLLVRTALGNWPFIISKINVVKLCSKNEVDEDESISGFNELSDYNIMTEHKAVIQGSFDLSDLCFDFSRNKQAMAMAAVCLVYSRISPPCAWHKKTVDKIMIIGNQLYLECVEAELITDMRLENLPAVFTIGPYIVEIFVYANRFADLMFKKSVCQFHKCLEEFFEKNTNAIVQIGKFTLAIWNQRNMFYCFDPYSRNNDALKCRNGTACVSMNSNLQTLVDTVVTNFDNREDIFYIHAVKVLKVHRDAAQAHLYSKNMTMNDISPETLKKYKMKKSKKCAIEKPITVDTTEYAMKMLLAGQSPGPSLIEVGSNVDSILKEHMPPMLFRMPSKSLLRSSLQNYDRCVDLDSPSLSDTQIDPARPIPPKFDEEIDFMDLDSFELTLEEVELQGAGEGEAYDMECGIYEGEDEDMIDDIDNMYLAMNQFSQVGSQSLESYHSKISAQINTDITCGFLPFPREILYPTNMSGRRREKKERELAKRLKESAAYGQEDDTGSEPEVTQSQELTKETNFIDLPDDSQLIRGTFNVATYGVDIEYMAPFVCIMAATVAKKYAIISWSSDIIDYVMTCGSELYNVAKFRYDQVPKLEFPKVSLGQKDYSILVDYLFDTYMKQPVLEMALQKILFKNHDIGLVVTPSYGCTVFVKNHLYYLYDPYGSNEVGLGEGPTNEGVACFARFKNVHALCSRIIYNKNKRESVEPHEYTRFVLSYCTVSTVRPESPDDKAFKQLEDESEDAADYEPPIQKEELKLKSTPRRRLIEEPGPEPEDKVGYQFHDGYQTIQGTTSLKGRANITEELKEDHFVSICAGILLSYYPLRKWNTKRVNYVIDQGINVFTHADNLDQAANRTIKNVLIGKHFFDIIVKTIEIPDWKKNKNMDVGINTMMSKHNFCIIQFANGSYVIYKCSEDFYHLFDPYPCKPSGKKDSSEDGSACWIMFRNLRQLTKRIRSALVEGAESYNFYSFDVTSIRKAPKKVLIAHRMQLYLIDKQKSPEIIKKAFYENQKWLEIDPIPWSRIKNTSACGKIRGKKGTMWCNWDTEYPNDLFSLVSNIHQTSDKFQFDNRGKQTLANLVIAIAMTDIYELSEWNKAVVDSILVNGDNYFTECVKDINEADYELSMDDLKPSGSIFPYSFEVSFTPVVEGTLFLLRTQQYNLYKALKMFFDGRDNRCGIISATKEPKNRFLAFGKIQEGEYFMFDCEGTGPPMFPEREGTAYILRCLTMARLLHLLVVTLWRGDFYIYDVNIANFESMT